MYWATLGTTQRPKPSIHTMVNPYSPHHHHTSKPISLGGCVDLPGSSHNPLPTSLMDNVNNYV